MKKGLMKNQCKNFYEVFFLIVFLMINSTVFAQVEKSKTIEKTYSIKKGALVKVNHRRGKLHIKKSSSKDVKALLSVSINGKHEQDVNDLLNIIDIGKDGKETQVSIYSNEFIRNWRKINGRSTLVVKSGETLKGIQDVKMDLEIHIPDGVNLEVSNKYDEIVLDNVNGNVDITNYNGNVTAGNISGDFSMNLKYGKAAIGNAKDVDITLYESTLSMGNMDDLKLNTKYSKHSLGNIADANIQSYEGDFTLGKIRGDFEVNGKYSKWSIASFNEGKIQTYEGEYNIGSLEELNIDSKYSDFKIGTASEIDFERSYEDDMEIGTLGTLKSEDSKYSDVNINKLTGGIYLEQDYQGDYEIESIGNNFTGLEVQGKGTDLEIPLGDDIKYQLEVEARNGDISIDEDNLKSGFYSEKSNTLNVKGNMNDGNENSPKVIIKGYNLDIELD